MLKKCTKEELSFIRQNKTKMTKKQLAKKLGCSEYQLSYALKKYKLKTTNKEKDMLIAGFFYLLL